MRFDVDHGLTTVLAILLPVVIIGAVGFAAVQTLEDPPAVTAPELAPPSTLADESLAPAGQTTDVIGAGGYHDMDTPVLLGDSAAGDEQDEAAPDDEADATAAEGADGSEDGDPADEPAEEPGSGAELTIGIDEVDRLTEQGALAVLLNVTVLDAADGGTVTVDDVEAVHPAGTRTLPFVVPVGDEDIPVTTSANAELRVVLVGWFGSLGGRPGGAFESVAQTRVVDTGEPVPAGRIPVELADIGVRLPPGATHLVAGVIVAAPEGSGTVRIDADDGRRTSAPVTYRGRRAETTLVVAPIGDDAFDLLVDGDPARVIVEAFGVFTPRQAGAPGAFSPTAPVPLLDTAGDTGPYRGPLPEDAVIELDVGDAGAPGDAYAAVLAVTLENRSDDEGAATVAVGPTVAAASNVGVNVSGVGRTDSALLIVDLDEDQRVLLRSGISGGATQIELLGWFA